MIAAVSMVALLLSGCAVFEGLGPEVTAPVLIEKTDFPQLPSTVTTRDFYLKLHLMIGEDGSVRQVSLENSSGDRSWDSAAVSCVMKWRYSPAMSNDKPIRMKIDQTAHVLYEPPIMMDLSEILCATQADADSVYAGLKSGVRFEVLASKYSIAKSKEDNGHLGNIDINRFPEEVSAVLKDLKPGEFTSPLKLGWYSAVFLRAATDVVNKQPS